MTTDYELKNKTGNEHCDIFTINISYRDLLQSQIHPVWLDYDKEDKNNIKKLETDTSTYLIIEVKWIEKRITLFIESLKTNLYFNFYDRNPNPEKFFKTHEDRYFIRMWINWLKLAKETGGYLIPI